jgi:hypothetical protein
VSKEGRTSGGGYFGFLLGVYVGGHRKGDAEAEGDKEKKSCYKVKE